MQWIVGLTAMLCCRWQRMRQCAACPIYAYRKFPHLLRWASPPAGVKGNAVSWFLQGRTFTRRFATVLLECRHFSSATQDETQRILLAA